MMKVGIGFFNRNWMTGIWAASICFLMGTTPSYALFGGRVDSFSADQVQMAPDGKVINTSKIYVTKDAMRMDGMPFGGGRDMPKMDLSLLVLKKQNKQYFYNHDKKLVFESPLDEENLKAGYKAMGDIESEKVLGKEKVSGYTCVKKEVVSSVTMMGITHKSSLLVWENKKFEFPLKTQDEDGNIQKIQNIKTEKPGKKLFRPLTGYKRVDNMMAVMGLDFNDMVRQENLKDEEEETQAKPGNDKDVNVEALMAKLQQSMGENMSPEDKAQMVQIMTQAMNRAKQVKEGKGAAAGLWKIIPRRAGDKIGSEMATGNTLDAILGTQSTLRQVFDYYQKKLKAKGWKDGGTYTQDGRGTMSMRKGAQRIMFAWADNPGMKGTFKLFYNVHYTGPVSP